MNLPWPHFPKINSSVLKATLAAPSASPGRRHSLAHPGTRVQPCARMSSSLLFTKRCWHLKAHGWGLQHCRPAPAAALGVWQPAGTRDRLPGALAGAHSVRWLHGQCQEEPVAESPASRPSRSSALCLPPDGEADAYVQVRSNSLQRPKRGNATEAFTVGFGHVVRSFMGTHSISRCTDTLWKNTQESGARRWNWHG